MIPLKVKILTRSFVRKNHFLSFASNLAKLLPVVFIYIHFQRPGSFRYSPPLPILSYDRPHLRFHYNQEFQISFISTGQRIEIKKKKGGGDFRTVRIKSLKNKKRIFIKKVKKKIKKNKFSIAMM